MNVILRDAPTPTAPAQALPLPIDDAQRRRVFFDNAHALYGSV